VKLDVPLLLMLVVCAAVSGRVVYENRTKAAASASAPSASAEPAAVAPAPEPDPYQECDAEDIERRYIAFNTNFLQPLAKRDGLTWTGGGCDSETPDELLCVECFSPGGEAWTWCTPDGCELAETSPELFGLGADFGACERPEQRDGLIVIFQRWANR